MVLHKSIRNKRIQNAFTEGFLEIVEREPKTDEYGTVLPGQTKMTLLGKYGFYFKAINTNDIYEFQSRGVELEHQVRIPLNYHIKPDMTGKIGSSTYNIAKVFQDFNNSETEILLAKEGGGIES